MTRVNASSEENIMIERIFPRNEHKVERAIRVALGLALISLVFVGPQTPWGWLGAILVVTGAVGSCPIYTMLGISTCPVKQAG